MVLPIGHQQHGLHTTEFAGDGPCRACLQAEGNCIQTRHFNEEIEFQLKELILNN